MTVIGLTGGIASGKSTVARLLKQRGATVIDADEVARAVAQPGSEVLKEIKQRFGESVIHGDGSLKRSALAAIIFEDPSARRDLNAIMHPRIYVAIREQVDALDPAQPVVVEAALLAETYSQAHERLEMKTLLVVDCPPELQMARLRSGRGLTEQEARQRLSAQAGSSQRRAHATYVIDNSGTLHELEEEVDRVWSAMRVAGRL